MARVLGAVLAGVDGIAVEVEVRLSSQLPRVDVVGLPEAAVRESAARVRAAITAVGHRFPERRVTVNLAPAAVRKSGAGLDLPIAVGVLAAGGTVEAASLGRLGLVGELALDGRLRPVRGALALALALRDAGCARVVVPRSNAGEAALTPGLAVLAADDLPAVLRFVQTGLGLAATAPPRPEDLPPIEPAGDLADVRGQERAKRALEIAAAGGHHLLLVGPPGAGKSMLASRLPGLLPPLEPEEALVVTRLHSAAGLRQPGSGMMRERPFRAPHHSTTRAGLIGGGAPPRPGELSLAHHGVLFLDEFAEYPRTLLDALREPLETGVIHLTRASGHARFPARPLLVAAMNPCPCSWLGHPKRGCRCTPADLASYASRISGPVLDRLDLQIEVPALTSAELMEACPGEPTGVVRARVLAARERQRPRGWLNFALPHSALRDCCSIDVAGRSLISDAMDRGGMSARAVHRALRVARTIADLAGEERVTATRLAEALQHRAYEARRFAAVR